MAARAPRRWRRRRCRRRGWGRGRRASRASQPALSPSATKQMSWLSGLSATSSPRRAASRADVGLGGVAEREQRVRELLLVEHAEHVGLVLAVVDGPVHLDQPVVAGAQLGVVTGRDRVEAERQRPVEHRGELDLLVAAQARVGRAAGGVLVHEVLDHVLVEALGQVPDVERDADHVGGPAGVVGVLDRAAAAGAGAVRRGVAREREVDAGDVVAGLDGAGRGDGRVDAAGHGGEDLHRGSPSAPAPRARSTTGPIASTTASTSAGGARCGPSEKRSECRACVRVAAHREQHVRGLRHAGRAGRAGGALDAAGVEQHQQRVALAAGEAEVGVAGQPVPPTGVDGPPCRCASGTTSSTRRTRSSRSAADPGGVLGLVLDRRARRRPRSRRSPGRRGCRCGCRAPGRRRAPAAVTSQLAAYDERADAVGAADLVPGERQRVDAARPRSRPAPRRRPGRRRCAPGCRARRRSRPPRRPAGGCRPRCWPTSPRPAATEAGSRSIAARSASTSSRPACVDRQQLDLGARRRSASQSSGSRTAWCSIAVDRMRVRRGSSRAARPEDALEREVVGLGAAGGEDHLARAGSSAPARSSRGTPRRPGGRAGRRRAASSALPTSARCAVIASTAAGTIGVVAAWSR